MAKIVVAGNSLVVVSAVKLEDLKLVNKYRPEALVLKGGEDNKEEIFRVGVTECGAGEIGKFGVFFGGETHDEEKFATVTICNAGIADKEEIADKYGAALMNLNKVEELIPSVLEVIGAEKDAIMAGITVQI